jgi:hypothetical protein
MTALKKKKTETDWPADRIEHWPIEKLIPSKNNARNHPEEQIRLIASANAEFGWTISVGAAPAGQRTSV